MKLPGIDVVDVVVEGLVIFAVDWLSAFLVLPTHFPGLLQAWFYCRDYSCDVYWNVGRLYLEVPNLFFWLSSLLSAAALRGFNVFYQEWMDG